MFSTRLMVASLAVILVSCVALVIVAATGASASSDAIPEDAPGPLNESSYQRYWADDVDNNDLHLSDFKSENATSRTEFERRLARSTDIPFEHPPKAVEDWNRDDFGDYDPGGSGESVHPESATLVSGRFIRDGFVDVFAIQPSTVLLEHEATRHIAPNGEVLAISDYHVTLPEDDTEGPHRVRWSLTSSRVESIELSVNGTTLDSGSGHQVTLTYSSLSGRPQLGIEASITAKIRKVTRRCKDWNSTIDSCEGSWHRDVDVLVRSMNPSITRDVIVNEITGIDGRRVRFETNDDRIGAVVHPDTRWSEITIDGDVRARSNWWFYSAGKTGWRTMITETESGSSNQTSSVRPLQIYAFPSKEEPYVPRFGVNGTNELGIEETWGTNHTGPSLPSNIDIEAADPYENADSIALTSTELDSDSFQQVTVKGIVRGQSQTVTLSDEMIVRETEIDLSFLEANSTTATVLVEVTENGTGDPVTTGTVTVGGKTVDLNASGNAVLTVQRPPSLLRGEYTPVHWWRISDPLASASTYAPPPANFPSFEVFARFVLITLLWFLPVVAVVLGFDYSTDGALLGLRQS